MEDMVYVKVEINQSEGSQLSIGTKKSLYDYRDSINILHYRK